jgi:hypothetical protein
MNKLKNILFAIFHPSYWVSIHMYNKEWDEELNDLMNRHTFHIVDDFTVKLGNKTIWYRNHPYGSFTEWDNFLIGRRPSRRTRHIAMTKLIKESMYDSDISTFTRKYLMNCRDKFNIKE